MTVTVCDICVCAHMCAHMQKTKCDISSPALSLSPPYSLVVTGPLLNVVLNQGGKQ